MPNGQDQPDVIVIGGGVIGCAVAWRLSQAGRRTLVIERGEVGREASRAAGGMLAPFSEADRDDDFFRLAVASRALYAGFARELRDASGIDIEYRTEGTLYLSLIDQDDEELEQRWAWQREAGLNVRRLTPDQARRIEPLISGATRWALEFPDDHQVDNRRLISALEMAARAAGVQIETWTEVRALLTEERGGRRRVLGVSTARGERRAPWVVIAAGSWSSLIAEVGADFAITPVRGQMVALEMPAPPLRHVIYSRRGYLIPRRAGFLIAGSTSEHAGYDQRVTAGGLATIIAQAAEILPAARALAVTETWAGLRPASPDGLPVLGADPTISGLIYATGHFRNGILLAPLTAQVICELIAHGASSFDLAPFSVTRFALLRAAG
jgi:glycine oxidase